MLPDGKTERNCSNSSNSLLTLYETERRAVLCKETASYDGPTVSPSRLDFKTVADKMRVVNWWLSLEAKEMTATMKSLRQTYRAPSKSNDLFYLQHDDNNKCLHPRITPGPRAFQSVPTRIPTKFSAYMINNNDRVSQGLATDVPTEDDSCDGPGTETVCTALSSHVASVDPFVKDISTEESVGPFIKEVSALYESNSTQAEIEECKTFLACQMVERKTFLNSTITDHP
jgi:hypothetical protein